MYSYIPAKDVKRARRFYEETIGLQASQAFWQVEDIERGVAELKKRGVKFEQYDMPDLEVKNSIYTGGGARAAWFKDSEGNILALIEDAA